MSGVPIRTLVGGRAVCRCGAIGVVQPGRNKASALGSTARPPRPFLAFPPGSFAYEFPNPGPVWYQPTYILACPRCGNTSYPEHHPIEPAEAGGKETPP